MVSLYGLWLTLSYSLPLACSSLQPLRDGKARPKARFSFHFQKLSLLDSSDGLLAEKPHLETRVMKIVGSHLVIHLVVPLILGRRGAVGWPF